MAKSLCMLADSLNEKTLSKLKYPVAVEDKLDGVRVIAKVTKDKVEFFTRNGKELFLPQIAESLQLNTKGILSLVFDGEITSNDRKSVAGQLNHIRAQGYCNPGEDDGLVFHIFDLMNLFEWDEANCPAIYTQRKEDIFNFVTVTPTIRKVLYTLAYSENEIHALYDEAIDEGKEGIVVKSLHGLYEWKRSKAWLKKKAEPTCDLICYAVSEGTGKREGKVGALLCRTSCSKLLVRVGTGLDDATIDEFTKEPPLGKIIEVKYNAVIDKRDSDTKSLFLPVFVQVREDKTEANSLDELEL